MSDKPKNMAASVKARLLTLARQTPGESFQLLVARFAVERLLYRLSQSPHADRFLLKGAMLFVVWDQKMHRPTRDVDLLAFGPNEQADMAAVFRAVAHVPVPDDGLVFDPESVRTEEIREDEDYHGVRVRLMAWLGKAEVPIQIDLGSGDAVTPGPEAAVFPPLLDFPPPHIRAYPVYTVVAEKYEAMVKLEFDNTRMKDFFDLWFLARRFEFDGSTLHAAIHATFARRETPLGDGLPAPLTDAFAADATKQVQWSAFVRRNSLTSAPALFGEVIESLRRFLEPTARESIASLHWRPSEGWIRRPASPPS